MSFRKTVYLVMFNHFVSDIISSQNHFPLCQPMSEFALTPFTHLSAIVSILTPPLPLRQLTQCVNSPLSPTPVLTYFSSTVSTSEWAPLTY